VAASGAFQVVSFEFVRAGERAMLLRLTARTAPGSAMPVTMLAESDGHVRELRRVPEPIAAPTRPRRWSAAFVVDAELFAARPAFALRFEDATLTYLASPQERTVRGPHARPPSEADPDLPLSESRRRALLVLQRDLESERARHADTQAEARRLRLELTRARSIAGRLAEELAETRNEAEQAQRALRAARQEVARLNAALAKTQADAQAREERAAAALHDLTIRLEAKTAEHLADAERSTEERAALESQIAAARGELEHQRETIDQLREETAVIASARDDAQQQVAKHRDALALYEAALDSQMEHAAAADAELAALDDEREAETQAILRAVRRARAHDLDSTAPRSPFPRWEEKRERLARWAAGENGNGAGTGWEPQRADRIGRPGTQQPS
jgi:hypothetical protein